MFKRLTTLAAAVLIGIVGFAAAPAQAAPTDCPSGYLCLWSDLNYSGTRTQFNQVGVCINVPPTASSMYNRRTSSAYLFRGSDCSLLRLLVGANQAHNPMPTSWTDNVRSIRLN